MRTGLLSIKYISITLTDARSDRFRVHPLHVRAELAIFSSPNLLHGLRLHSAHFVLSRLGCSYHYCLDQRLQVLNGIIERINSYKMLQERSCGTNLEDETDSERVSVEDINGVALL